MRYICDDEKGGTNYDRYFEYLHSVRAMLGEELFLFASDPKRHDLTSKGSLHDAWVASLNVKSFYGAEMQVRDVLQPDVELVLLGPYHDRTHCLSYFGVKSCRLDFQFCNEGRKRDLLQHELRYENSCVEHELLFDGNMVIEVICDTAKHVERILSGAKY